MTEIAPRIRSEKELHINQEWSRLDSDSREFGQQFADNFSVEIQGTLDIGRLYGNALRENIRIEHIETYSDPSEAIVGGDYEFIQDAIMSPAFITGFLGHRQLSIEEDELDDTEWRYMADEYHNEFYDAPRPTKKGEHNLTYIAQFTKEELADYAAYWYRLGAVDRLGGYVEERRKLEQMEERQ